MLRLLGSSPRRVLGRTTKSSILVGSIGTSQPPSCSCFCSSDGGPTRFYSNSSPAFEKKKGAYWHKVGVNFTKIVDGPATRFGIGNIATLTESSVVGTAGQTVILTTVATAPEEISTSGIQDSTLASHFRKLCKPSYSPLTVNYRQRLAAVGKIPTSATRSDNRRPTDMETLASRAIDRALRPLLKDTNESIQVSCSVQACALDEDGGGGHPVALALNSASAALQERLKEPVACVYLSVLPDGTTLLDPSVAREDAVCELLYAGTRDKIVMMEFSGLLPEAQLAELCLMAHGCIQPLLDTQEELLQRKLKQQTEDEVDENAVRESLGLPLLEPPTEHSTGIEPKDDEFEKASRIFEEAEMYCVNHLRGASLVLFGATGEAGNDLASPLADPVIHSDSSHPLLSKSVRGRRENLVRREIQRLLQNFESSSHLQAEFRSLVQENPSILSALSDTIHSKLLKKALYEASTKYKTRADGRGGNGPNGCATIRPLSMTVPALPEVVHGSALFTRGETQVLCTATLGPPRDGILQTDPYAPIKTNADEESETKPFHDLPVGSLRYLKTQEYLESDLNTRKVRADREQTGDSGTLKERRRAFLQYDFPAYSKGQVQVGSTAGANRREVGHGALAEKAILPTLPSASDFPYTVRMTSEVTSSNGSSSMASVCGATLALLDAGVPIKSPAAGLSVGLSIDDSDDSYSLLLDITGTEDHYGAMDFKIAGTYNAVTALQLDVKRPLPLKVVSEALDFANSGRRVLLKEMEKQSRVSSSGFVSDLRPRPEFKDSAPRVEIVRFDPMRKKDLLGPGGVVIRQMEDRFNVSLDLTQEGQCLLFGDNQEMVKQARAAVMDLVADVEVGEVYQGTVIEIRDFGAIIELLRNKEGLCHVSEIADRDEIRSHPQGTIGLVNDILKVGQKIEVICTAVDPVQGTIRLRPASRPQAAA
jgi:polyribonucleotide nucleotidyltransferase